MDYETYDDDRPTDRADELDNGDDAAGFGTLPGESVFEAPDLATAFLAALDAVDDRAYVSPPLDAFDPPPSLDPTDPTPAPEPAALPLELGTLALDDTPQAVAAEPLDIAPVETDEAAHAIAAAEDTPQALYAAPSLDDYVIEHEDPPPSPRAHAVPPTLAEDKAVAEAFAREQAALELWGSDEAASDEAESESEFDAPEVAALAAASDEVAGDLDADAQAAIQAEVEAETAANAASAPSDLVLETVSNQDSYYDPDTLRLARPLFSPDEPRAFAGPVYVGDQPAADGAEHADGAQASAEDDVETEVLEDLEEFVAFSLGETRCVVPIRNVIEIGRIPDAVGVPNAPAWLHGLGNLRGQVLSLIDLRAFLGIGRVRPATGRMLVLRDDDDVVQAGLLVDHVHQIVSLSATRFHPVPETLPQHYAKVAWGVCDYGNFTMIGLEVDSLLGVELMTAEEAEAL
jgi:purine-binding chemotaxis protein CheW